MIDDVLYMVDRENRISTYINPYTDDAKIVRVTITNQEPVIIRNVEVSINERRPVLIGDIEPGATLYDVPILYGRYRKANGYTVYWDSEDGTHWSHYDIFEKIHR